MNSYNEIREGYYKLNIGHEAIIIQHHDASNKVLKIEKMSCKVIEGDDSLLRTINIIETIRPHSLLGILKVESYSFLAITKISELVGTIDDCEIFKLLDLSFIPLFDNEKVSAPDEVFQVLENIKNLLAIGFYYSHTYDLTNSRQKQRKYKLSSILEHSEKKFFWNYGLNELLIDQKVDEIWTTAFIFGYVNIQECNFNGEKLKLALISRRSINHAGTRYNARGITDGGNVANYVESEQILVFKNRFYSVIIIRGSAPIFFEQSPLNMNVIISRNPSMTSSAFMKHLYEIQHEYKYLMMYNLMSEKKPEEELISSNFKNQFLINNINHCKYHTFDMHAICKKDDFGKLEEYIEENLITIIHNFGFFCEDSEKKSFYEQKGVFRVNCLDCLDRTNIFQSRIVWQVLLEIFKKENVDVISTFGKSFYKNSESNEVMKNFKIFWSENGDYISLQYAGTPSTSTNVTLNGGEGGLAATLQHKMVSVNRYYIGNFMDEFKQRAIDSFLQTNKYKKAYENLKIKNEDKKAVNEIMNIIKNDEKLSLEKHAFSEEISAPVKASSQNNDLIVFVGTWNMAAETIKSNEKLFDWLYPVKSLDSPDIYVIGFQEIVELSAVNLFFKSNASVVENYKTLLNKNLRAIGSYSIVKVLDLVGILLIVYAKEGVAEHIKGLDYKIIKTGVFGALGNKGSCMIRFSYFHTNFAFSCGHFVCGEEANQQRISEFYDVINTNFRESIRSEMKLKDHDYAFVFGDLNFRIELENSQCRSLIKSKKYDILKSFDQFYIEKTKNPSLVDFIEGELDFDPTYKYDIRSREYDTSKKQRTPSWCDRIFWKKNGNLEIIKYGVADYLHSDHRPVLALLKVKSAKTFEDLLNYKKAVNATKIDSFSTTSRIDHDGLNRLINSNKSSETSPPNVTLNLQHTSSNESNHNGQQQKYDFLTGYSKGQDK